MRDPAAIVLAAGGSSRMGMPKQLLELDGVALVRRAALAALHAAFRPVVVVLGARAPQVQPALAGLGVEVVVNACWRDGIGSSIRAGVAAMGARNVAGVALTLADQALIDAALLTRLLGAQRAAGRPIAASRYAGTTGVPALFAREMIPLLLQLDPAEGCKRLLREHAHETVLVDCPAAELDVDTPRDWAKLRAMRHECAAPDALG